MRKFKLQQFHDISLHLQIHFHRLYWLCLRLTRMEMLLTYNQTCSTFQILFYVLASVHVNTTIYTLELDT